MSCFTSLSHICILGALIYSSSKWGHKYYLSKHLSDEKLLRPTSIDGEFSINLFRWSKANLGKPKFIAYQFNSNNIKILEHSAPG